MGWPPNGQTGFGRELHYSGKKRVVGINVSVAIVPFDALKASFTAHSVPNHPIVGVNFVQKEYSRGDAGGNGWGSADSSVNEDKSQNTSSPLAAYLQSVSHEIDALINYETIGEYHASRWVY